MEHYWYATLSNDNILRSKFCETDPAFMNLRVLRDAADHIPPPTACQACVQFIKDNYPPTQLRLF